MRMQRYECEPRCARVAAHTAVCMALWGAPTSEVESNRIESRVQSSRVESQRSDPGDLVWGQSAASEGSHTPRHVLCLSRSPDTTRGSTPAGCMTRGGAACLPARHTPSPSQPPLGRRHRCSNPKPDTHHVLRALRPRCHHTPDAHFRRPPVVGGRVWVWVWGRESGPLQVPPTRCPRRFVNLGAAGELPLGVPPPNREPLHRALALGAHHTPLAIWPSSPHSTSAAGDSTRKKRERANSTRSERQR